MVLPAAVAIVKGKRMTARYSSGILKVRAAIINSINIKMSVASMLPVIVRVALPRIDPINPVSFIPNISIYPTRRPVRPLSW